MSSVLVVEDDVPLRHAVSVSLRARDFRVDEVATGEVALTVLKHGRSDLVILDLGLPGIDGNETIRRLREFSDTPVIVLTARDRPSDKVAALDAGADDYVTKPFDLDELLARVRAALRRRPAASDTSTAVLAGPLEIDLETRQVRLDGRVVHLTRTEFGLLEALVRNPGKLLSHEHLLREVWGPSYSTESNYLRTYIGQLRKKLADDATAPRLILTEPGIGYRWIADDPAAFG